MQVYLNPKMLNKDYSFSESGVYKSINGQKIEDYLNYIDSLPLQPQPEVFGLHDNANIIFMENQTRFMLNNLLKL